MPEEKPVTGENVDPEKGPEGGKGDAGDIDPEVAELMKDPVGIKKVLGALKKANKEAETRRLKAAEDEKKALEEQGKFKELAEKEKARAEASAASFKVQRIALELRLEAIKAGAIDPEDVVALCDRAAITITDDFATVAGAKEAVEALKTKKAHLFKATDGGTPPPGARPPAPRAGFGTVGDFDKASPRDLITRGLEKK